MLLAIPEPLVHQIAESGRPQRRGQKSGDQDGFVEPGPQHSVEYDDTHVCLVNTDRFVVGLVIQPTRGVVVPAAVAAGHIEWHVQAAGDLVQDFFLELRIRGRRLLGLNLAEFPTARENGGHAALEFHQVHRFDRVGLSVGRGVGEEDCGEVGRRLGRRQHGQRVTSQLGEQRQCWRDLGNAAALARPIRAEVMDHRGRRHAVVVERESR